MYLLICGIIILILIIFFLCSYVIRRERLEIPPTSLRNRSHMPATVHRLTNTILTPAPSFSDKMDQLTLPKEVKDNFNEWIDKGFVSPVKDQMLCGGCWAFATCGSLADRLAIATNGKWYSPFGLSEQVLISCGGDMGMQYYNGCDGGIPHMAIDILTKDGVPVDVACSNCAGTGTNGNGQDNGGVVNPNNSSTCMGGGSTSGTAAYTWWQTGCNGSTSCNFSIDSTCPCAEITSKMIAANPQFAVRYKTIGESHNYTSHGDEDQLESVDLWPTISQEIIDKNVDRMKKAIYYEGPITVGYQVYADFYDYWPTATAENYYQNRSNVIRGGHAVTVVGWKKVADGTPVWIIKNSWGENGGYGFPNGPQWKDPITGISGPKYRGGFWNHIMGIDDSFIEANAFGAHPNLQVPQIKSLIGDVPEDWYNTMTLRDIYQRVTALATTPTTTKSPKKSFLTLP